MDLHKQSQEQSMNIDMSNQSMTPAECNYYQSPFNEMKRLDSSQTCTPQGQPLYEQDQQRLMTTMSDNSNHNMNNSNSSSATSTPLPQSYAANNSDIMSVHTVLSQQSAEMNKMALQSPTTGNMASGNPQSMEHNLVNASQSTMSSNNSPNPMMHSSLITNSDPNSLSSPQLSVPNNKMSNGLMDNNNNLILSHENMFGITSSSNGINVNHSPSFGYSEHSMQPTHVETQPELHSQVQLQAPPAPPAQAQLIIESQAGLEHHPVVPSQCNPQHTVATQNQRAIEEEQERVAAAAQQVMAQRMAQQYAMMQHPNEHMMQQHQSNEHMVQQHQPPEQMMQQHQPTEHLLQHQPSEQMMQQHQTNEHLLQQQQPTEHMLQQHQTNEHLLQQHQSNEQMLQHQTTEHLLQHQSNEHMLQHQPTKHILQQHPPNEHLMQQHQPSEHLMQQHSMMVMKNESLPPPVPSHETPHVVLSQMSILSPSTPSPSVVNSMHAIKGTNLSLHNAVVHQQHQVQLEYENNKRPAEGPAFLERKKSRRHTVSNGSALNIDTKNLPTLSSCPRSAAAPFTRSEERKAFIDQQKKSLGMIDIPPPPTLHELGIGWVHAKDYDGLSRAQLISRLIELETEKKVSEKTSPENQEVKVAPEEDKSTEDEEEEEEMLEEQEKSQKMQCKWRECGLLFDGLQNLIAHINFEHVKSGKPCYSCEWENCSRNEKPFTKRHKMYNHLRTHTGERPFVCTEEGCGKKFSRPDSLTTHVKTHSNVRPYTCSFKNCGKAYYHARSLKKHEKSHETASMLSTPNSSIQYSGTSGTPYGHADYLNSQSQSLPNSPHYSLQLPVQHKPYTPSNNVLFSPAGMVEQQNNEHLIAQPHQLLNSVNQQQGLGYGEP